MNRAALGLSIAVGILVVALVVLPLPALGSNSSVIWTGDLHDIPPEPEYTVVNATFTEGKDIGRAGIGDDCFNHILKPPGSWVGLQPAGERVDYYNVYRKSGGLVAQLSIPVGANTSEQACLRPGTYRVVAVDHNGNASGSATLSVYERKVSFEEVKRMHENGSISFPGWMT